MTENKDNIMRLDAKAEWSYYVYEILKKHEAVKKAKAVNKFVF